MAFQPRLRPPRAVRGVGLIEVLIAVLVLAIGLLGIAAMQATTLRNSQSALERSQAIVATYTILDAMRANLVVARGGSYDIGKTCIVPAGGGSLAANDLSYWIQTLHDRLGTTSCGTITCASNVCTIQVQWDDSRGTSGGAAETIKTVTRI